MDRLVVDFEFELVIGISDVFDELLLQVIASLRFYVLMRIISVFLYAMVLDLEFLMC